MRHGRLMGWLLLLALGWLPPALQAAEGLDVVRVVVAETQVAPGANQIFQVTLGNNGRSVVQAGLKVEIRDARDRRQGASMTRTVVIPAKDEGRYFFRFAAPQSPGEYRVQFEALTPDFKEQLIPGGPVYFSPFTVGAGRPAPVVAPGPAAQQARIAPPSFIPPSGLRFELPDVLWENLNVTPTSLLLGEPLMVRVDLRNVGGDIARAMMVKVSYFNTRTPNRPVTVTDTEVQVLAPGEKLEMEFEILLPDDAILGEYRVTLEADVGDKVEESDEFNNRLSTDPIRLSNIKQVFPEAGFAFEEAGLFLFRWDSLRYDEFKVQVGSDPAFADQTSFFDIPQGEKWSRDKEVVPLEGELPGMAQGLMDKAGGDTLFWRVMGRDSISGRTGFSRIAPFTIKREKKPAGAVVAPAAAPAPPPPSPATPLPPTTPAPEQIAPPPPGAEPTPRGTTN